MWSINSPLVIRSRSKQWAWHVRSSINNGSFSPIFYSVGWRARSHLNLQGTHPMSVNQLLFDRRYCCIWHTQLSIGLMIVQLQSCHCTPCRNILSRGSSLSTRLWARACMSIRYFSVCAPRHLDATTIRDFWWSLQAHSIWWRGMHSSLWLRLLAVDDVRSWHFLYCEHLC